MSVSEIVKDTASVTTEQRKASKKVQLSEPDSRRQRHIQAKEHLKKVLQQHPERPTLEHILFIKINGVSGIGSGDTEQISRAWRVPKEQPDAAWTRRSTKTLLPPPKIRSSSETIIYYSFSDSKTLKKSLLHKAVKKYAKFADNGDDDYEDDKPKLSLDEQALQLDELVNDEEEEKIRLCKHSRQHRNSSLFETITAPIQNTPAAGKVDGLKQKRKIRRESTKQVSSKDNENGGKTQPSTKSSAERSKTSKGSNQVFPKATTSQMSATYDSVETDSLGTKTSEQSSVSSEMISFYSALDLDDERYEILKALRKPKDTYDTKNTSSSAFTIDSQLSKDLDRQDELELMEMILSEIGKVRREVQDMARENVRLRRERSQPQVPQGNHQNLSTAPNVLKTLSTDLPNTLGTNRSIAPPTIIVLNSVTTVAPNTLHAYDRTTCQVSDTATDPTRHMKLAQDTATINARSLDYRAEFQTTAAHIAIYCAATVIGIVIGQLLQWLPI